MAATTRCNCRWHEPFLLLLLFTTQCISLNWTTGINYWFGLTKEKRCHLVQSAKNIIRAIWMWSILVCLCIRVLNTCERFCENCLKKWIWLENYGEIGHFLPYIHPFLVMTNFKGVKYEMTRLLFFFLIPSVARVQNGFIYRLIDTGENVLEPFWNRPAKLYVCVCVRVCQWHFGVSHNLRLV